MILNSTRYALKEYNVFLFFLLLIGPVIHNFVNKSVIVDQFVETAWPF